MKIAISGFSWKTGIFGNIQPTLLYNSNRLELSSSSQWNSIFVNIGWALMKQQIKPQISVTQPNKRLFLIHSKASESWWGLYSKRWPRDPGFLLLVIHHVNVSSKVTVGRKERLKEAQWLLPPSLTCVFRVHWPKLIRQIQFSCKGAMEMWASTWNLVRIGSTTYGCVLYFVKYPQTIFFQTLTFICHSSPYTIPFTHYITLVKRNCMELESLWVHNYTPAPAQDWHHLKQPGGLDRPPQGGKSHKP